MGNTHYSWECPPQLHTLELIHLHIMTKPMVELRFLRSTLGFVNQRLRR
jgi:hypothetical protein